MSEHLETDAEYWQAQAKDREQMIATLCNYAWGAVYGKEHETEWEYPAQAIRHLIQAYREAKGKLTEIEETSALVLRLSGNAKAAEWGEGFESMRRTQDD